MSKNNASLVNNFNQNNSIVNSVIAKLQNLDVNYISFTNTQSQFNVVKEEMEACIKKNRETIAQREDYDISITRDLDKMKHDIYDRTNR